jgi:hypothetical protein
MEMRYHRALDSSRLEVLHLPADVMAHSVAEKTGPIGPLTRAKNDPSGCHELGGLLRDNAADQSAAGSRTMN